MSQAIKAVVVLDDAGGFSSIGYMNEKAYKKSIEQGELWVLHPETEKVLPAEPRIIYARLLDRGTHYEAVTTERAPAPDRQAPAPAAVPAQTGTESLAAALSTLTSVIAERKATLPEGSYTAYLFREGIDKIRKKTGEEAVELILARRKEDEVWEAADLLYHLFVLLAAEGITAPEIAAELEKRAR